MNLTKSYPQKFYEEYKINTKLQIYVNRKQDMQFLIIKFVNGQNIMTVKVFICSL